ncbi:MAG: DUF3488 domain-containing protein [Planctomycetes bacterium]|nr:DUF3488 domain-containing protein [Planctomycetota bacterium]
MKTASRESQYFSLARMSGIALVLLTVFFQRRGLMHWSELVFLGVCIGLQESFLRLPNLRRWRTPMLIAYSMAPLLLILFHSAQIRAHSGDFVKAVLNTPLPLVLVSVQIMVLYVRDAPRLVSVVLVLALFSTVIGVRRPIDDSVWPWLAGIAALGALFLALQHPGMLFHGVYVKRTSHLPPAARPGGVLRQSFVATLPLLATCTVVLTMFLYFAAPRISFADEPTGSQLPGQGPDPNTDDGNGNGPRDPGETGPPRDPNKPPPSVAGLTDGVDLGDFGEIQRNGTPALEVRALYDAADAPSVLYLRAFTYAKFDGERWSPLEADAANMATVREGPIRRLPGAPARERMGVRTRAYELTMQQAGLGKGGVVPMPVEAQLVRDYAGPLQYNTVEHTLRAASLRSGQSMLIEVQHLVATPQQMARELRNSGVTEGDVAAVFSAIPPALRAQIRQRFKWFDQLQRQVAATNRASPEEERGVYAAAQWIVRMFEGASIAGKPAWTYSLDFRPLAGPDSLARFLDTDPKATERFGHCEYFASAMCALLRCFGVPCRLAAGFAARQVNLDGVWSVTTSEAHAWVEVYFKSQGWVAFDPTPASQVSGTGTGPVDPVEPEPPEPPPTVEPADSGGEVDGGGEKDTDWIKDFDGSKQKEVISGVVTWAEGTAAQLDDALLAVTSWLPDGLLPRSGILRVFVLLLPVTAVLAFLVLRRRKRKRIERHVLKGMGGQDRKRERGMYFQLLLLLAGYGYHKRPSETPREFAQRVMRRGGETHVRVEALTEMYYAMRFGEDSSMAAEFKRALHEYGDSLKAALHRPAGAESADGTAATQ